MQLIRLPLPFDSTQTSKPSHIPIPTHTQHQLNHPKLSYQTSQSQNSNTSSAIPKMSDQTSQFQKNNNTSSTTTSAPPRPSNPRLETPSHLKTSEEKMRYWEKEAEAVDRRRALEKENIMLEPAMEYKRGEGKDDMLWGRHRRETMSEFDMDRDVPWVKKREEE